MSSVPYVFEPVLQGHPKKIFDYEVIDFLGQGAGSFIYAVTHPVTKQVYALKHVVRKTEKDDRFIEQLEGEFEVGRQVNHPGLRKSVDFKVSRTLLRRVTDAALILELFDGQPLETHLPEPILKRVDCFIQTGKALESLHALNYVHCDLKPNNILLDATGHAKVIDLGQAVKVGTRKSRIQGTPDYIAPEQVKCLPVTIKTDVFNFGATMYWALSGRKMPTLFTLKKSENSFLVDSEIATPAQINPHVPETLSNLVMECVRTNPTKRPNDMTEVTRRLEIIEHTIRKALYGSGSAMRLAAARA